MYALILPAGNAEVCRVQSSGSRDRSDSRDSSGCINSSDTSDSKGTHTPGFNQATPLFIHVIVYPNWEKKKVEEKNLPLL